ncbi:hypothetical protein GUJ93_ZPchr0003g16891 [Zizania palustris]|uniref:Uncharacterized protein n=1 Tax=Zizania palustris TaxID=103762 RepID=A0A8J5SUF3_ZIZPA|nr:hypothetical protein GUJ93_ZPchr0003g16891 [Zizania palustris]
MAEGNGISGCQWGQEETEGGWRNKQRPMEAGGDCGWLERSEATGGDRWQLAKAGGGRWRLEKSTAADRGGR